MPSGGSLSWPAYRSAQRASESLGASWSIQSYFFCILSCDPPDAIIPVGLVHLVLFPSFQTGRSESDAIFLKFRYCHGGRESISPFLFSV